MNNISKIVLWSALGLAILIGAIWQFFPLEDAKSRMNTLPLYGTKYIGQDVPLSSFEETFLKNVNLLKRVYRVGKDNLFVTVLDGTNNRHIVHDPYYCFTGSGWTVVKETPMAVPGGEASIVKIERNGESKEAMFWFTDGKEVYRSPLKYWWQATLRRLTLGRSGPEPVLVVVQPVGDQNLDWKALEKDFSQLFSI